MRAAQLLFPAPQMHCSSVLEVGLAAEHHEDSEARVERRFAVQRDTLQPEVGVCRFRQDGRPESSRTDQLAYLLATSASAFDSLQRQIESEPEMPITFAVQIEVCHSNRIDRSSGSCSSTRNTPSLMACRTPGGT